MSEVRLVVREADRDWSGTVHGSDADRAVAALSADPVTLEELEAAMARFIRLAPGSRALCNLSRGLDDEPHDAGLVVIDLAARLVVVESTYSSPGRQAAVYYHNGDCGTDIPISYELAEDWLFLEESHAWQLRARERRRERAARPPRDVRGVLYGGSLLEFIAREAFAAFARRDEIAAAVRVEWTERARERLGRESGVAPDQIDPALLTDDEIAPKTWPGQERYADLFYGALRDIHAAWMLTPRDDLGGVCPRAAALDGHDHVSGDLQDRCDQWSRMDACPPGLCESSHAYRFGAFGTHEMVKYYDLVRELLWSCWRRLTALAESPDESCRPGAIASGDFLASEVGRLEVVRETWFDEPDLDCHGRTPRSIIHRERARLPEGVSGHEAMIDPDCPCCQMMADLPGPTFWHLDGSAMDDDFAFDIYHATREEWEAERREWDEMHRQYEAKQDERRHLGVSDEIAYGANPDPIWTRSVSTGDVADVPLGVRVFGVGCRLAELIVELRAGADRDSTPPETQRLIDRLNRDFGNLREVLQGADASFSDALLDPVVDRFRETLDSAAAARADLEPRCRSLSEELRALLDPPPPQPRWEPGDLDVPF